MALFVTLHKVVLLSETENREKIKDELFAKKQWSSSLLSACLHFLPFELVFDGPLQKLTYQSHIGVFMVFLSAQ